MNKKTTWLHLIWLWLWLALPLYAQDDTSLQLNLRRDFGYGSGANMQGTFSFRVEGPDNLDRVAFFIDDTEIGSDNEPPFRLQFKTDNYALGVHTLSAVGYTSAGQEIQSNRITRNFVSPSAAGKTIIWLIVPLLVLSLGGRFVTSWIANRGRQQAGKPIISGPLGGTICVRCKRPFAIHLWSFRIVTARGDRCPHCGKWQWVHRMPDELLDAAAEATAAAEAQKETAVVTPPDDEARHRRQLEDSRFDN
ncbi:MAG: hypothetical protein KC413_16265 [Anaerolineales bacterium]|nr:hypothetical protein [Anaerolineales bacterium]MCA9977315.1 hypothetical protein [Anaerolineales bacterium]MCB8968344.1 Ig-like domain-containing protein [Ardenticatenaceae bacterium]